MVIWQKQSGERFWRGEGRGEVVDQGVQFGRTKLCGMIWMGKEEKLGGIY